MHVQQNIQILLLNLHLDRHIEVHRALSKNSKIKENEYYSTQSVQ